MTTFLDGPAKGQTLMLHRAVKFLRVTQSKKGFDALDQPDDKPEPGEVLYAYQITAPPGHCHINCRGKGSGFYPIAEYRFCDPQPLEGMMEDKDLWAHWCEHQPDPLPSWQ